MSSQARERNERGLEERPESRGCRPSAPCWGLARSVGSFGGVMLRQLGQGGLEAQGCRVSPRGGKLWPRQATRPLEIHFRTACAQRGESFLLHTPLP